MRQASFQEIIFSFLFFLINDVLLMLFLHSPKITLYYGHSMLTWRAVSARLLIHRCPSVGPYVPIRRAQTKKRIYRIRLTLTKMSKDIEKHLYHNKCFSLIGQISIQRRWTDIQRRWTAVQSRWTDIQRRWTKNSPWCINNLYQEKKSHLAI